MRQPLSRLRVRRGAGSGKQAKRRGFTLVEVIVATAVTVAGLLSTFYLLGLGTAVNSDARNMAQAYQIAQQEIELLRNMPYATLGPIMMSPTPAGTPEVRFLKADGTADSSRPGDSGYPGQIANLSTLSGGSGGLIITNDPAAPTQVKHVTVVVRWRDPSNQARSAIVGTIIARGGMGAR